MKNFLTFVILLCTTASFAQKDRTLKLNNDTNLYEVTYYHDNGEISQTGFYTTEGKLQGEWLAFDTTGKKTVLANYDNGKKVGKWFYWNNKTLKEVDYNDNVIANVQEWTNKSTIAARD